MARSRWRFASACYGMERAISYGYERVRSNTNELLQPLRKKLFERHESSEQTVDRVVPPCVGSADVAVEHGP